MSHYDPDWSRWPLSSVASHPLYSDSLLSKLTAHIKGGLTLIPPLFPSGVGGLVQFNPKSRENGHNSVRSGAGTIPSSRTRQNIALEQINFV